jgi:hypothetical protein
MAAQRLYFLSKSHFVIFNGVRKIYKTIKQGKESVTEESHLFAVEEDR